jgi:hypothetical protein
MCVTEQLLLQGGQRSEVKHYLRQLTKLAHKFDTIWVLILKYTEQPTPLGSHKPTTATTASLADESLQLNTAYSSFYQSLSQFPAAHCLVQTRVVAQEAGLPSQLHAICQEAANTATVQHNLLLSCYLHRPFLQESSEQDEAVLQAHCKCTPQLWCAVLSCNVLSCAVLFVHYSVLCCLVAYFLINLLLNSSY